MKYNQSLAILVIITAIALLLSGPLIVYADSPVPATDYTKTTQNGQYIFVMLAPDAPSAYNQAGFIEKDDAIRRTYKQSGLYQNNGSSEPLWTVDWYSAPVDISSDGRHLVKYGPWATSSDYMALALSFYEDGHEIRSYNVSQLVAFPPLLPHSVSHYQWLADRNFDDSRNVLTVRTAQWASYDFDITTGRSISGIIFPWPQCLNLVAVVAVGWIGISFIRRRQRRRI